MALFHFHRSRIVFLILAPRLIGYAEVNDALLDQGLQVSPHEITDRHIGKSVCQFLPGSWNIAKLHNLLFNISGIHILIRPAIVQRYAKAAANDLKFGGTKPVLPHHALDRRNARIAVFRQ